MAAVVMFGLQFFCNQQYERECKSSFTSSMMFIFGGAVAGLVVLLAVNGMKWEFTPFTLFMASLAALDGMIFNFCSMKALGKINLSLYSLFSMLGGMMLPFFQGILPHFSLLFPSLSSSGAACGRRPPPGAGKACR